VDPLEAVLAEYRPLDEAEARDVARIQALIAGGDPWSRQEPLHVTASALVVEPTSGRVLLRWHDRMQRWLQVGGHGDPGEHDPWQIACREAAEETGLTDLTALDPGDPQRSQQPVQIVIVPVPASKDEPAHEHADIRYLLVTSTPETATAERPGAALRWLTLKEAKAEVEEENLRQFLGRVEALLKTRSQSVNDAN
jgi:8-oxo-dGTP pyrophosphatase MutT (NUDIX family)